MPRLFSALRPPDEVCAHLADALVGAQNADEAALRWTPVQRWHVTLGFFGDDDDPVRRIKWLTRRVAGRPAPRLRIAGGGTFSGVLWAGIEPAGSLDQVKLAKLAQAAGAGRRGYRPHLTLARWSARQRSDLRTNERSDLRSDLRSGERSGERSDQRTDQRTDLRSDQRWDLRSDERLDQRTDLHTDEPSDQRWDLRTGEHTGQRSGERSGERTTERTNERSDQRSDQRFNERLDQRLGERSGERFGQGADQRSDLGEQGRRKPAVPAALTGYTGPWFTPVEVLLVRSDLGVSGPAYQTIERVPLSGA